MNRVEFVIEYTGFASAPHTGRGIGSPASSHEHHLSNSPHLQRGNSYPGTLLTPLLYSLRAQVIQHLVRIL
jgi:hypothetical protein